jgi:magnesium chelatase subunit D
VTPIPDWLRPDAAARRSAPSRSLPGRGAPTPGTTGRVIGAVAQERPDQRVAVRATAVAHATRTGGAGGEVTVGDLRAAVAEETRASLVILAVDASGSMAGRQRLDVARRVAIGLLDDAYRRRDRVALIVFRGHHAEVVLRPTASIEIARHRLADLPTGGTTPLAAGLQAVTQMARAAPRAGGPRPVAVLITDGRATAGGADPWAAALDAARELAATRSRCLVIDAETGPTRLGLARKLATALGAEHLELDRLERSGDDRAVERAIQQRLAPTAERP